jgi:EAL domain-containing protein (putative c-di-GMP-specific phosphodiesterase class I)/GGDEF domain-containing protein
MNKLWFHSAAARLTWLEYRSKIVLLAGLAVLAPLAVLWRHAASAAVLAPAAVASVVCLAGLILMLRPIAVAARELRASLRDAALDDQQPVSRDEGQRLVADVRRVSLQLERLRARMHHRHPVTNLPTREPFLARLAEAFGHEESGALGVVRFGDYDRLAAFDPAAADRLLHAFARRLEASLQYGWTTAQVNRDCFAVWAGGAPDAEIAAAQLQALAFELGQELGDEEMSIAPDVSIGAAIHPTDGCDPATLLNRAVAVLPRTGQGAGKVSFYSQESSSAARTRFSLEQSLRQAINREEMLLHFQPVVDLTEGRVTGAEALLRWRHPERGLVSPGEFIPVLEETGMMDEVGLWVLNTACQQVRAWEDRGLKGLKMAVNLSARQFRDPTLNTMILRTLELHRLEPNALELELTETATMEDAQHTRQLFGELRALGVSVAIDDFGTGYSSLSYLKNLPFSKLKIDREFVSEVHQRRDSHAICTALVELARGLDIHVLAEGVETREEADTLRALGCSMFQGFFFARPLAADDFAATVTDPDWLEALASPVHRQRVALKRRLNS